MPRDIMTDEQVDEEIARLTASPYVKLAKKEEAIRATAAVVREPSFVVQIVAPASAEADARLAAIRSAYRQRFNQQSVGLVLTSVCAAF